MARPADVPLVWLFGDVKTSPFSAEARVEAGFLLRRLQQGEALGLPQSRPMPTVGAGCHELRIPDRSVTWRIVYHVAGDAVVIESPQDLNLARESGAQGGRDAVGAEHLQSDAR